MEDRKKLKELYQNRTVTGGVYRITCGGNGRSWLKSAADLNGQRNRFQFAVLNDSCLEPGMRAEWAQYGAGSFSFTVLEELEKKKTQTDAEFAQDISALLELWREKQEQGASEQ